MGTGHHRLIFTLYRPAEFSGSKLQFGAGNCDSKFDRKTNSSSVCLKSEKCRQLVILLLHVHGHTRHSQ